jgi:non-heme chloroperoxidase
MSGSPLKACVDSQSTAQDRTEGVIATMKFQFAIPHGTLSISRRELVFGAAATAALMAVPSEAFMEPFNEYSQKNPSQENGHMSTIVTKDGTSIYYKDWGKGQPIVFSHGWPLDADAWDAQMMFFGEKGFRVIAHDRRSNGRSSQTWDGNDMNTYADDLAELFEKLDLKKAIMVGHSTGGGEVVRYIARHGSKRVAKAALVSAVPPIMVKSDKNPNGTPIEEFDKIRAGVAGNRSQFYKDLAVPFFGFNRPGAPVSQGIIDNFWLQGMVGSVKGQYDCVKAFSETDFNEDLGKVDIPMLVMHGDDDQIVPFADAGELTAKRVKGAILKVYPGYPHGMPILHADVINKDLLAFIQG